MRKYLNKAYFILMSIILSILLTACGNLIDANKNTNSSMKASTNEQLSNKNENIEALKNVIVNAVSDDIWYNGPYSDYKGFEMQKIDIEIYNSSDSNNETSYVCFNKNFENSDLKDGNAGGYYMIGLNKQGKRGYGDTIALSIIRNSEEEIKQELKQAKANILIGKTEIQFGGTSQPVFSPMDEYKQNIIKKIEEQLPSKIQQISENEQGKYKVYIKNFRDTDFITYVVIENEHGKSWLISFEIDDNGGVHLFRVYDANMSERIKYRATQFKKVSFEKEIIVGKVDKSNSKGNPIQQSDRQQSADLYYKNSKWGFTLTFPEGWKGKYAIDESETGISVMHKWDDKIQSAEFFTISTMQESKWNSYIQEPGQEPDWPLKKIGIKSGVVYVKSAPGDFPYAMKTEEEKRIANEFSSLQKDIPTILSSFKFTDN